MAYKTFEVTKKLYIYKTKKAEKDNRTGTISKGATIKVEDINDPDWFKLKSVSGNGGAGAASGFVRNNTARLKEVGESQSSESQFDDGNGGTTGGESDSAAMEELSPDDAANLQIDDAFFSQYSDGKSSSEYMADLQDGLRIKDIRGVLGIPHQFSWLTDGRIDGSKDDDALGRTYAEKFIKQIPLLLMTPGIPKFMAGFDDSQKQTVLGALFGTITGYSSLDELVQSDGGKYYTLKFEYNGYFQFVNPMLRAAAWYLGIEKKQVNGHSLGSFNWLYDGNSPGISSNRSFGKFLGPYAGCIAFYANCGNEVSESFGNDTGQSQLASSLNSISDTGRELNFLIGNLGSAVDSPTLTSLAGADDLGQLSGVQDTIDKIMGGNKNIFSNILKKSTTLLAGGRLVFPEIWTDSSFGRSYNCSMKLTSPSGDAFSVFMNILVPLYHLLGFTLPRHAVAAGQAYFSPFLVRAYCKSKFNIDMGIVSSLSVTKGGEGEWTTAGLFTSLDVSFEIKDLYNVLFMSTGDDGASGAIVSNITELDYIANTCGVNINDQEIMRTAKIATALNWSSMVDRFTTNIFTGITQSINEKLEGIFGAFS